MRQLEFPLIAGEQSLWSAVTWAVEHRRMEEATRVQHYDHRRWLSEFFGADRNVNAIGYVDVMSYVEDARGRDLMDVTIKKRLATLRMAMEEAYRRGLLRNKPDWWPRLQSDSKPNEFFWDYETYRRARMAFDPQQRIGIDVFFHTGMHLSDVLRWRRGDVDLTRLVWRRYNTKSHAAPDWVPLNDEFRYLLESWFLEAGIVSDSALVAPEMWRYPVKPMARVCAEHGFRRCTPNRLRSSAVSRWAELGFSDEEIAWMLGHRSDPRQSSIIRRHYKRMTPARIDAIRARFPTAPAA